MLGNIPGGLSRFVEERALKLDQVPEIYGPTDVNAQSSNGRLAVGLNEEGTMTVLRWPRPSFYDQVKYHARRRDEPRLGVAPNEGAFLGLRIEDPDGSDGTDGPELETTWLRDWETSQQYANGFTDAVTTEHRSHELGLTATVVDVVAQEHDVFAREVTVERDKNGPTSLDLLAFENLNLVVSKEQGNPVQDWAREGENTDTARYDPDADGIIHRKTGVDKSTGRERSVAIGMGFERESNHHHVGGDAYEPAAAADARDDSARTRDAYDAATAGTLPRNKSYTGQTTGVVATRLDLEEGEDDVTVLFIVDESESDVAAMLEEARDRSQTDRRAAKRAWVEDCLDDPPMPGTDDKAIQGVARRALVTLVTNYDPETGAVVASIATQSPYNLDWIRDGAYFNHVFSLLGLNDWVETRNRWYASLQQHLDGYRVDQLSTPPGNWAMNYYADGVPGGLIPWEIDETGLGIWTLYDHYAVTGDEGYLQDVYPAIRRAADFLVLYRDPETGLHYPAHEDDNVVPSQTVVGGGAALLGVNAAARAATALGRTDDASRYADRRDELERAIDDHLWNADDGAYNERGRARTVDWMGGLPLVADPEADPTLGWPVEFKSPSDPQMAQHLEHLWDHLAPTFNEPDCGDRAFGQYEAKGLITLARGWHGDHERMERVREGVRWLAHEHATSDTHVMGEVWLCEDGEIHTSVSQPHVWEQLLVYYASLEAYPPEGVDAPTEGWDGVVNLLRKR